MREAVPSSDETALARTTLRAEIGFTPLKGRSCERPLRQAFFSSLHSIGSDDGGGDDDDSSVLERECPAG
jgi:hypothetical protein